MSLAGVRWREFKLRDIFDIRPTASGIDKIKLVQGEGTYPYITRSDQNNGVNSFVCEQPDYIMNDGNCISVGLDTQTAFYQPAGFYTGQNIQVLRSPKLNASNAKFMLPLLRKTLSIFSWGGNGATLTRLRRSRIFLPIDEAGRPDYAFMEKFIYSIEQRLIHDYVAHTMLKLRTPPPPKILSSCGVRWRSFRISDVFVISPGRRLRKEDMTAGDKPFIGASDSNNGVTAFVANSNSSEDSNVLGVNYNGSVAECFYHPYTCLFSDDVKRFKLRDNEGDKYIYEFLKTAIRMQKVKYTYGYKFNEQRMLRQIIMLPVNETGSPDWDFMRDFMRHIEAQKLSAVIAHFSHKITHPRTTSPPS